jgi:hypothetical protein
VSATPRGWPLTGIRRTSLGNAEPVSANTLTAPPLPAGSNDTKDHRPSAVTATPNGFPGTGDSRASPAGSCGPGALAVLQPGTATLDTTGPADAEWGVSAAGGVLEVQATSASARAATAMAGRPESLTHPTLARHAFRRPAEFQARRRPGQEMSANV